MPVLVKINFSTVMEDKEKKNVVSAGDNLTDYMETVIADLEKEGKFPAAHVYRSVLRSFTRFWNASAPMRNDPTSMSNVLAPIQDVFTPERLKEYETWLTECECSPNTISTYMRTLQAVYNRWMPPGMVNYNPILFKELYTKVESRTKRALTAGQMRQLETTEFCVLSLPQQRVLACFMLMFMLRGMPFIDLAHLRKQNLQGRRIVYRRHKTGKLMVVDVPPDAFRLLQKYRNRAESEYLFPILNEASPGKERYHLYQDMLRRFNRELARLMKKLLPGVSVSSYTARHTWATLAYHSGTPLGLISQSLGHSSIRVTMSYLKPFDAEVIDKVNRQVIALVKGSKKKKVDSINMLYGTLLR